MGRVETNMDKNCTMNLPIGSVPSNATSVAVTSFDQDCGATGITYAMQGVNKTTGNPYPILFPAPSGASGSNVVADGSGNKYYTNLPGTLTGNASYGTDNLAVPATVQMPQTDANGNLLLDSHGHIVITGTSPFAGADLQLNYTSGNDDCVDWFVSYQGTGLMSDQQIVLIR